MSPSDPHLPIAQLRHELGILAELMPFLGTETNSKYSMGSKNIKAPFEGACELGTQATMLTCLDAC